jgi:ribosomal protein S18 acetylase RimI-like enzyme
MAKGDAVFTISWVVPATGVTFLAFDGVTMVGALTLRPNPSDGGEALIEPMSVLPGQQRLGVGTELWRNVVVFSRRRGDSGINVYALDRNPMAMGFYPKMGCRVVGTGTLGLGAHTEPATHFWFGS